MTRDEFASLFEVQLARAAQLAEERIGRPIPRSFRIRLHGPGHPTGEPVGLDEALDVLYLGPDRFFRIIDLAVVAVARDFTDVFIRVSGHRPGRFAQTWNNPPGSGPFKQLLAQQIQIADE